MKRKLKAGVDLKTISEKARLKAKAVAKACGVSARTLRRYSARQFAEGSHKWLVRMHLEPARAMLAEGKPCKEAALHLGYSDYALFSKRHKSVYGESPGAYRRRMLESMQCATSAEQLSLF